MFCAYRRPKYQVSVNSSIGPLVSLLLKDVKIFKL